MSDIYQEIQKRILILDGAVGKSSNIYQIASKVF